MNQKNPQERKPDDASKKADQVSKEQSSAEEQKKNIPQSNNNTAEENKPVPKQEQSKNAEITSEQTKQATPDILTDDTAQIFAWLEIVNQTPKQHKKLLETVETRIEVIEKVLTNQNEQAKRIPGVDKRIETLDLVGEKMETSDRYLSELNKIKLQTELTNLRAKRDFVWLKFVKVCGSEKKALKYQNLSAKAKSPYYHKTSGYFVKQRILKILNVIINKDRPALVEVKMVADDASDDGVKLFNEKMRDLLYAYDDDCVLLCSHVNRKLYYKIMRLTVLQWDPELGSEIEKLVIPDDPKQD